MDYREALEATRRSGSRVRGRDEQEERTLARNVCPQKEGTILRIFIPPGQKSTC